MFFGHVGKGTGDELRNPGIHREAIQEEVQRNAMGSEKYVIFAYRRHGL